MNLQLCLHINSRARNGVLLAKGLDFCTDFITRSRQQTGNNKDKNSVFQILPAYLHRKVYSLTNGPLSVFCTSFFSTLSKTSFKVVLATEDVCNLFWCWLLTESERGRIMLFLFMPSFFDARVLNEAFKGKKVTKEK